jgi:hypothetical protein
MVCGVDTKSIGLLTKEDGLLPPRIFTKVDPSSFKGVTSFLIQAVKPIARERKTSIDDFIFMVVSFSS